MPNFFVHWLVAERCIDKVASDETAVRMIKEGAAAYKKGVRNFKTWLVNELESVMDDKDLFNLFGLRFRTGKLASKLDDYLNATHDPVTCFSAYMLGACGPDFWTLPSDPKDWKGVPSTAGLRFDLGHYHRSQAQFKVAIRRWKDKKPEAFQEKVERSYYLGMASHIATDLVVHQLVNVSAGGYKFLKKDMSSLAKKGMWENEHGGESGFNLWNTHNKVEHYWDSYIRYRYFGDCGPVFPRAKSTPDDPDEYRDEDSWFTPWGFPVVETLQQHFRDPKLKGKVKGDIVSWLEEEKSKYWIEQCFILPRFACDNILNSVVDPFIYEIISEAYPPKDLFPQVDTEAKTAQMDDPKIKGSRNEKRKLKYFSTPRNIAAGDTISHNFLCYRVCPNLGNVRKYGWNIFYDTTALKQFMEMAAETGSKFVSDLAVAFKELDPLNIGSIDHFWNLDTGLGIDLYNVKSATDHEVITRLDFVHISDFMTRAGMKGSVTDLLNYNAYVAHFQYNGKTLTRSARKFKRNPAGEKATPAFQTYYKEFEDLDSVSETDASKYLSFLRLNPAKVVWKNNIVKMEPEKFLDWKEKGPTTDPVPVSTKNERNEVHQRMYKNRLTLEIKAAIPIFGRTMPKTPPVTGFYFLTGKNWTDEPFMHEEDKASLWINGSKHDPESGTQETTELDFVLTNAKDGRFTENESGNMYAFRSNLLLNLEIEDNLERKIGQGDWNNVVTYKEDGKPRLAYSRNFAIGTGRGRILYPKDTGYFWPEKDFDYFSNVSPTENIFFSLHVVVNNPTTKKIYDALNKKELSQDDLKKIVKIDCMDFVKIVLFYSMDVNGAKQLDKCYVDGLLANVTTVDE